MSFTLQLLRRHRQKNTGGSTITSEEPGKQPACYAIGDG